MSKFFVIASLFVLSSAQVAKYQNLRGDSARKLRTTSPDEKASAQYHAVTPAVTKWMCNSCAIQTTETACTENSNFIAGANTEPFQGCSWSAHPHPGAGSSCQLKTNFGSIAPANGCPNPDAGGYGRKLATQDTYGGKCDIATSCSSDYMHCSGQMWNIFGTGHCKCNPGTVYFNMEHECVAN
jgi:hypothetical protein